MVLIEESAPAKINLDLCIISRRPDGYHELDSLVVFGPPADRLILEPADRLSLELGGPFAPALAALPDNLVVRAARRLAEHVGQAAHVRIKLEKNLPAAAGLGGGSGDAAATLRGLNRFWRLGLGIADLAPLARDLGADVSVCLAARPARMRGIGERLEWVSGLPPLCLLLVNPGRPLATAAVFAALGSLPAPVPEQGPPPRDRRAFVAWLRARANHLEAPARRLEPQVDAVLKALAMQPGCELARMSGSGATCFALFADRAATEAAAGQIRRAQPDWWVAASEVAPP
jgi:4-diphosphocytidyl-2-C-methyl-D-erythritol kinase